MEPYSNDELQDLNKKAMDYIDGKGHTQCLWLYRDKSAEYFNGILNVHNGMMIKYEKDKSGDPRNHINGQLDGLSFMERHDKGKPPEASAFGEYRFQAPVQELMKRTPNVYFSDFYCMQGWHYVTLVVTSSNHSADTFCRDRLLRLDSNSIQDNPFLYQDSGKWWVSNADNFNVEVFVTEDIQIYTNPSPKAPHTVRESQDMRDSNLLTIPSTLSDAVKESQDRSDTNLFSIPRTSSDAVEKSRNILDSKLLAIPDSKMTAVFYFGRASSISGAEPKNLFCKICNLSPTAAKGA